MKLLKFIKKRQKSLIDKKEFIIDISLLDMCSSNPLFEQNKWEIKEKIRCHYIKEGWNVKDGKKYLNLSSLYQRKYKYVLKI